MGFPNSCPTLAVLFSYRSVQTLWAGQLQAGARPTFLCATDVVVALTNAVYVGCAYILRLFPSSQAACRLSPVIHHVSLSAVCTGPQCVAMACCFALFASRAPLQLLLLADARISDCGASQPRADRTGTTKGPLGAGTTCSLGLSTLARGHIKYHGVCFCEIVQNCSCRWRTPPSSQCCLALVLPGLHRCVHLLWTRRRHPRGVSVCPDTLVTISV